MFTYVFLNLSAVQIMNYSMILKKVYYFQICFHLNPSRTETSNTLSTQGRKGMTATTVWEFQTESLT